MNASDFLGKYKLVSWENHDSNGGISYPVGTNPVGVIQYNPDKSVFVNIMSNSRKNHSHGDLFSGDSDEFYSSGISHLSYYGEYYIHADQNQIVHRLIVCSYPNWVGTEQIRMYKFNNKENTLTLSVISLPTKDGIVDAHLTWKKVL